MGLKDRYAKEAERLSDKAISVFEDALDSKKLYYVTCDKCGKRNGHHFPDVSARVNAITKLHELGYGRPAQEQSAPAVELPKLLPDTPEERKKLMEAILRRRPDLAKKFGSRG